MTGSRRPRIAVTGPDRGGAAAWWFTRLAVWRAGGRAVRVTPQKPRGLEEIDGLIIGGGADVDPGLYGEEPIPFLDEIQKAEPRLGQRLLGLFLYPLLWLVRRLLITRTRGGNRARDALEKYLIREAERRSLPVLGICRGMQLMNVTRGGTLHQEITGFYREQPNARSVLPAKQVAIAAGSRLEAALGVEMLRVNALHDQATARLGDGLRIVAREASGVVQAIESEGPVFFLGVQWHPEYLPQKPLHQSLFTALVSEAHPDIASRRPD